MAELRVPIHISEVSGNDRTKEAIRLGVPVPKGMLRSAQHLVLKDEEGRTCLTQARIASSWADGTVRWLLVDALVAVPGCGHREVTLCESDAVAADVIVGEDRVHIVESNEMVEVDTGAAVFTIGKGSNALLDSVCLGGFGLIAESGVNLSLTGCAGVHYGQSGVHVTIEENGPVRSSIVVEGSFTSARQGKIAAQALRFKARLIFTAGASHLCIEIEVHNPRAARHPGGLWDLDDQGTLLFEDVTLALKPAWPVAELRWYAEPRLPIHCENPGEWSLYQDSSGGENWESENHVDGKGVSTVTFRGYRVAYGTRRRVKIIAEGDRATPGVSVVTRHGTVSATVIGFWQNFPKSLRWSDDTLDLGLFPWECRSPFALQGGERKRATMVLEFAPPGEDSHLATHQQPLAVTVDPKWVEGSAVLDGVVAACRDRNEEYLRYIQSIVEGTNAFEVKREWIDEYGWRNYGDLYADHEAVGHVGPRPLVSHFNNQYDFIYGGLVHFLRTEDVRWFRLAEDAAHHMIDIDIYHTDADKVAFNHGLFWHTDHYKPAATCTHRTYSRHNGRGLAYGGGPSNEHNYTSGLLLYYRITGDPEAALAVRELADWVIAMDAVNDDESGDRDGGQSGLASKTVDVSYHKAGRGAGNSINALIDAFDLSGEGRYLDKAEGLIRRCIHPRDDIEALRLGEPEYRWSYLVFLQVLGKYLHLKYERGEVDFAFQYARESLLHYARWMFEHEVPYKDILHKVELPTETWSAQDVRKCHVLHLAAQFASESESKLWHKRADFFFARAMQDLLEFKTAYLTRPQVIMSVYGHVQAFYQLHGEERIRVEERADSFGVPETFIPKRLSGRGHVRDVAQRLVRAVAERLDIFRRLSTSSRL